MKDLYTENCKILMKETEDKNGKISHAHSLEKINIVKISILPKAIYRI